MKIKTELIISVSFSVLIWGMITTFSLLNSGVITGFTGIMITFIFLVISCPILVGMSFFIFDKIHKKGANELNGNDSKENKT